jgi:hypothetical protein
VTVVALASLKGSPGVTTLACLVAAGWPCAPAPIVVECDPAGGDLAARFELSSKCGWPSFVASVRREGNGAAVDAHVQQLPGGLDVLVGTEPTDGPAIDHLLHRAKEPGARDLVVDLGRLPVGNAGDSCWLEGSDEIVLVSKCDAASLISLRLRATSLTEPYGTKLGLVVVGPRHRADGEIEAFTGIRLLGRIPSDRSGAALVSGEGRGRRRLSRSALVVSAARLASELAHAPSTAVLTNSAP